MQGLSATYDLAIEVDDGKGRISDENAALAEVIADMFEVLYANGAPVGIKMITSMYLNLRYNYKFYSSDLLRMIRSAVLQRWNCWRSGSPPADAERAI